MECNIWPQRRCEKISSESLLLVESATGMDGMQSIWCNHCDFCKLSCLIWKPFSTKKKRCCSCKDLAILIRICRYQKLCLEVSNPLRLVQTCMTNMHWSVFTCLVIARTSAKTETQTQSDYLPLQHTTLAENVENLISSQPRISAHLE